MHHYSTPCYQAVGPAQSLVGDLVGPAHWQPTANEPPIHGPAQPLGSAAVGTAHKQPTVKKGQLVRGLRQQLSGGYRWRVRSLLPKALQLTWP